MDVRTQEGSPGQAGIEGLEEMINTYRPPAMALALNILGNREDAEDACQEMFVSAFHRLPSLPNPSGAKKWLFTILYRKCLDMIRRRKRSTRLVWKVRNQNPSQLFHCENFEGNTNPAQHPPLPKNVLGELSEKQRAALSLWANQDYSPDEIASIMGCAAGTVRVHLFKARRKIKAMMEKDNVFLQTR